ncbi:AAA family ATPase [Dorea longicatena]|nr:AAA family ATPase [Dorea longicatena]
MQKLQTVNAETLLYEPLEKPSFVVDSLIPTGLSLFCGSQKIGKSWLMLKLCLCVSQGIPLWDMTTMEGDVLYLCLEDTFCRIQDRLFRLTDEASGRLHFAVASCKLSDGLIVQLEDYLKDYPDSWLIVIDTLQKVRTASKDNAYASDYGDISLIKDFADRHSLAVIVVHHIRKQNDSDVFNKVSGTTGLTGSADATFVLEKEKRASDTAKLYVTGRDTPYQEYTCNNYGRYGNVMCTAHSIEARDLFNAVLADINRFADMAVNDEKAVRAIERRLTETDQSRAKSLEKEKKKLNKRLAELDRLFSSLYEDKVMERITERNFEMMSGKYQKEQLEIEARLKEVTETLNDSYEKSQGVRDFLSLIRNYQGLKELDATIINALIDKILVSEREKLADGTVRQEIKIYYKFIGFVGELHITPTKRWTALKPKNCTVCGVEYVPSSGISKYCPACAKRIQREKSNESKRRSRERNRRACIELSAKNDRLK